MVPSKESDYLTDLFRFIVKTTPADGNVALERAVYDQVSTAATEATEVIYEDVDLGGKQRGPAKWVKPLNASSKHVILFMHGGGYSFGSLESHRKMCAHFAKACNTLALMVDYRLTPESPFPAALDDCVAAYKWLLDQGFEAKHIVTMGDSCGGGLTTTVPLRAIRHGLPSPGAAVSLSPWYDVVVKDSESLQTNDENDVLGALPSLYTIKQRYCEGGADPANPIISALYAGDDELRKLPPHWISCAGYDMLRDDGTRMAAKLEKAGVETVLKVHDVMQHVFEFMAGRAPEANQSIRDIGEWVRTKIGS